MEGGSPDAQGGHAGHGGDEGGVSRGFFDDFFQEEGFPGSCAAGEENVLGEREREKTIQRKKNKKKKKKKRLDS